MSASQVSPPATGWLNAVDVRRWRVLIAARVFTLAAALGLAGVAGTLAASATTFLALCVLATVMSVPVPLSLVQRWLAIAEGALAALILGGGGPEASHLMVYLALPPLVAGLQAGRWYGMAAVIVEAGAELSALVAGHRFAASWTQILDFAPWLLAGVGMGLLGAWIRANAPSNASVQAGYESAHHLLAQLRAVSRRLPAGLDTTSLALHALTRCVDDLGASRAILLVRSEGRTLVPLVNHGNVPFDDTPEQDAVVRECWASEWPAQQRVPAGSAQARQRIALPLQVGSRIMGVVVTDAAEPAQRETLAGLRAFLAEQSLRLETALLFDEVRSLATMEERHRLAREIHDGVAQEVASLGYLVDGLTSSDDDDVREVAASLRQELSRIVSELRLSIFDLRAGVTAHGGLGTALSDYAREIGSRSGMTVHLALSEQPQRLRADVETELLRIAQEAIINARKHAHATNLWVSLNVEAPFVLLRIEDDGVGSPSVRPDHFGLQIMRERADRIGAELSMLPRRHGGTSVVVVLQPTPTTSGDQSVHNSLAR